MSTALGPVYSNSQLLPQNSFEVKGNETVQLPDTLNQIPTTQLQNHRCPSVLMLGAMANSFPQQGHIFSNTVKKQNIINGNDEGLILKTYKDPPIVITPKSGKGKNADMIKLPPITSIIPDKIQNIPEKPNLPALGKENMFTDTRKYFGTNVPETTRSSVSTNSIPLTPIDSNSSSASQYQMIPSQSGSPNYFNLIPQSVENINNSPTNLIMVTSDGKPNTETSYVVLNGQHNIVPTGTVAPGFIYVQPPMTPYLINLQQQQQFYQKCQVSTPIVPGTQVPPAVQYQHPQQLVSGYFYLPDKPNYITQVPTEYNCRRSSGPLTPLNDTPLVNPSGTIFGNNQIFNQNNSSTNSITEIENNNNNSNNFKYNNQGNSFSGNTTNSDVESVTTNQVIGNDLRIQPIAKMQNEALPFLPVVVSEKKLGSITMSNGNPLSTHMQEYLKIKKILKRQCQICGKVCSRPSALKTHFLIHSGETPFKCPWEGCKKAFNVKSNMLRHLKTHKKKAEEKNT